MSEQKENYAPALDSTGAPNENELEQTEVNSKKLASKLSESLCLTARWRMISHQKVKLMLKEEKENYSGVKFYTDTNF